MAQKELHKVLKRSKTQVKNIESHIKEANEVLDKKQKSLVELDPKAETTENKKVESNDFEMDLTQKSAVKKEKAAPKQEAKQTEAPKAKKDESDKKDEKQTSFDLESLTEKNNKMWDVKFKEAK